MKIKPRDNCPVDRTAQLFGDRWSFLILRNLLLDGPHRFQDFSKSLPNISPTTLSARLKKLEDAGLVRRSVIDARPPKTVYEITELGQSARPVIRAMREFGLQIVDDDMSLG
ncbi:MAG: helix-turn-helix domain-containing protein [Pseudomonadota bacterium]